MDARKTLRACPERQGQAHQEIVAASRELPSLSAEQVYHDFAPRVFNLVRRLVANEVDAEDVTQDVLLQVVRKLPGFRGESAFPTWLHRVTVNAALSHRRLMAVRKKHNLHNSLEAYGADEQITTWIPRRMIGPDDQVVIHELRQLIARAIDELPDGYREVFVLADVEELSNAAIAERLGLSLPAVKSRLHRARAMLRDALAPHVDAVS
jgi:RNA polymerase sigma-70 factor (ECF subfamily)